MKPCARIVLVTLLAATTLLTFLSPTPRAYGETISGDDLRDLEPKTPDQMIASLNAQVLLWNKSVAEFDANKEKVERLTNEIKPLADQRTALYKAYQEALLVADPDRPDLVKAKDDAKDAYDKQKSAVDEKQKVIDELNKKISDFRGEKGANYIFNKKVATDAEEKLLKVVELKEDA
jgi:uncharacterized coiled-coil DUF342 family protein